MLGGDGGAGKSGSAAAVVSVAEYQGCRTGQMGNTGMPNVDSPLHFDRLGRISVVHFTNFVVRMASSCLIEHLYLLCRVQL
jgi:hypothetical protein